MRGSGQGQCKDFTWGAGHWNRESVRASSMGDLGEGAELVLGVDFEGPM